MISEEEVGKEVRSQAFDQLKSEVMEDHGRELEKLSQKGSWNRWREQKSSPVRT